MLLLTTPDYLPKMGGLTTHTLNVEKVLKTLGIDYEVFHWKNYRDVISFPKDKILKYKTILNIHSGFHLYMPQSNADVINFINGAEILFYSDNPLKNILKKVLKGKHLKKIEGSLYNIFISDFTFKTLVEKGLKPDYSRDIIFNMCVDTSHHNLNVKNLNNEILKFICVARDVPHKNFQGVIRFCEHIQEISGRKIELTTISNNHFSSKLIKVNSLINASNQTRDELLKESHFNLLFSLDHSKHGFFEGFGQIVQEAGCLGTPSVVLKSGGLSESVHHNMTGWVLESLDDSSIDTWWRKLKSRDYEEISRNCYEHTIHSHSLENWQKLFESLIKAI